MGFPCHEEPSTGPAPGPATPTCWRDTSGNTDVVHERNDRLVGDRGRRGVHRPVRQLDHWTAPLLSGQVLNRFNCLADVVGTGLGSS
jgi:hypothetical protein